MRTFFLATTSASVVLAASTRFWGRDPKADARPLDAYPKALCLDGSASRYYIRSGSGDGVSRFLIFFEGGGFCGDSTSCLSRSLGYLGSTKNDSDTTDLDHPFFNLSPEESPLLHNWNHVFVRYCDGGYVSGLREDPVEVGVGRFSQSIYFRGQYITEAVLADLSVKSGFGSATDVVYAGCSSGGIRTFGHLDYLRALAPASARVTGFPDSGFYLDLPVFTPLKQFVVAAEGQNATAMLNKACVADNAGTEERCLIAAVSATYIETPVFAWESRYDTDQRGCEMTAECAHSDDCIRAYGQNLTAEMQRTLGADPRKGFFIDSCSRHCSSAPTDDASGKLPTQAFSEWYSGGRRTFSQSAIFPCDECCSPRLMVVTV